MRRSLLHASVATSGLAVLLLVTAFVLARSRLLTPVGRIRKEIASLSPDIKNLTVRPEQHEIESVAEMVTGVRADVDRLRSERRELEEELRQVEADYRALFLNAVVGILQMNVDGQILAANPGLARILGYESLSTLTGKVVDAHEQLFVDRGHRDHIRSLFHAGSGAFELETRVCRHDGSVIWVLESGTVVTPNDSSPTYYEAVLIDITPRKKAEESLRELSTLLLKSQEEERRRIGRELHDSAGQLLAALEMSLDRLNSSSKDLSEQERETLSSCVELAAECSREVRSVSHLLHPPLLEELGLEYALREFAEGFTKRSGIEVHLDLVPPP